MQDVHGRRKPAVSSEAAEAIQKIIIDRNLEAGDKLPSQAQLAQILGAGARAIREAVKILEARGIVETHQGKGVFVKSNNLDFFLEILNDSLAFDVYRDKRLLSQLTYVRRMIESNVIHDLAEHPGPQMLKELIEVIDRMEVCAADRDIEEYNMLDVKFHVTLIGACGNEILVTLYRNVASLLIKSVVRTGYTAGSLEQSLLDHRRILEALIARDPDRAKDLMERHLTKTLERLREARE
jgi:GntR family transcriptional repressor for pyruvate dehydrogenase complex